MKKFLAVALTAALACFALAGCGSEAQYPDENINVIVQYSAGGGTDLSVRGVLDAVEGLPSGVNFAVSNVAGGAGLIGLNEVVKANADGYTLGVLNTDLVINSCLGRTDISVEDFSPLACALMDPFVLIVSADAPYSNLEEFVAYAKAHPGEVVVGETGVGAAPTLAVSAVSNTLGLDLKTVSYDGSADCVTAIVGGHIDATFAQAVNATSQVQAGNLKILGTLSDQRLNAWPDVPTFAEVFPEVDYEMMGFCIISAVKDVDAEKVSYLQEKLQAAVGSDKYAETLENMGMQTQNLTGDEITQFLSDQMELYTELCKGVAAE